MFRTRFMISVDHSNVNTVLSATVCQQLLPKWQCHKVTTNISGYSSFFMIRFLNTFCATGSPTQMLGGSCLLLSNSCTQLNNASLLSKTTHNRICMTSRSVWPMFVICQLWSVTWCQLESYNIIRLAWFMCHRYTKVDYIQMGIMLHSHFITSISDGICLQNASL